VKRAANTKRNTFGFVSAKIQGKRYVSASECAK
jgi:hypothetical protein